jgi:hypothetical protein
VHTLFSDQCRNPVATAPKISTFQKIVGNILLEGVGVGGGGAEINNDIIVATMLAWQGHWDRWAENLTDGHTN